MARKKIREYDSKRLLKAHIARLAGLQLPINVVQVKEATNFAELVAANPWMNQVSAHRCRPPLLPSALATPRAFPASITHHLTPL